MEFKQWLGTQESSAFTRRRTAAALGLAPPIPDASLHSRSTCPPGELDLIKNKKKKKKKKKKVKNESKEINPDIHIDKWLSSVDNLKRDLDDLESKKKDNLDDDDFEDDDEDEDLDDLDDLDDESEFDDSMDRIFSGKNFDDNEEDEKDDLESAYDDSEESDYEDEDNNLDNDFSGQSSSSNLRRNVGRNRPNFGIRRLPRDQVQRFIDGT